MSTVLNRLLKNVVLLFLFKAVNLFATLYMTRFLLVALGDVDYSNYKEYLAIFLVLVAIDLGIPNNVRNKFSLFQKLELKISIQVAIIQSFLLSLFTLYFFFGFGIIFGLISYKSYIVWFPIILSFLISMKNLQSWNFILHRPYINSGINLMQISVFVLGSWFWISINQNITPILVISFYMIASVFTYLMFALFIYKPRKMKFNDLFKYGVLINLPFQLTQVSFVLFAQIFYLVLNRFRPVGYEMTIVVFDYYMIGNLIFVALATPLWAEVREYMGSSKNSKMPIKHVLVAMVIIFVLIMFVLHFFRSYLFEQYTGRNWGEYELTPYLSIGLYTFTYAFVVFVGQIFNALEKFYITFLCHVLVILSVIFMLGLVSAGIDITLIVASIVNISWSLLAVIILTKRLNEIGPSN